MKKSILFTVLAGFLFLNLSAQDKIKTLEGDHYSIKYPESWSLDQSGQFGSSFFLLSQLTAEDDTFRDNINLIIQDISQYPLSLDQYIEASISQIKSLITDAEILESTRITSSNPNFHKLVYTGKQGDFNLKFEQHCYLINDNIYILTFTSEEDQFDDFQKIKGKIMSSLKIK